jgi:NADH-quinone oxidoreductase subunit L
MILLGAFEASPVLWVLSVVAALMTAFYMFRLLFIAFWGKPVFQEDAAHPVHESPGSMTLPMAVLALLSIIGGLIGVPHVLGGSDRIQAYFEPLFSTSEAAVKHGSEAIGAQTEIWLMAPVVLILVVILFAYSRYVRKSVGSATEPARSFLGNLVYRKFYFDELYESMVQKPVAGLSTFLHDVVELKVIDRFVNQTGNLVVWMGKNVRYIQTGNVGAYLFYMVISIILILFFNLFNK